MEAPVQLATYSAAFKNQHKYFTLRGFIFAQEMAHCDADFAVEYIKPFYNVTKILSPMHNDNHSFVGDFSMWLFIRIFAG